MNRILVVDDEQEVREYLSSILRAEEFSVRSLENGNNIVPELEREACDLILMDYRLPGKNGVEVVTQLRGHKEFRNLPIIMVTALDGEDEKVAALELGADDYIVKPFSPKELAARVRALLRRAESDDNQPEVLEIPGLQLNMKSYQVEQEGHEVYLTLTEFRILRELLKNKERVLSRDKLRESALGNLNVTDRTIDVHMASLRKKLPVLAPQLQTVRGVGYRLMS